MAKPTPKTKPAAALTLGNIGTIVEMKPTATKSSLDQRMIKGVADLTAVDRVMDDLEDAKSVIEEQIREEMTGYLLDMGCKVARQPSNVRAYEAEIINTISVEHSLRVVLSKSGKSLSDAAVELAGEHNIPTEKKIDRVAAYILNPKFAEKLTVMQAVLDALNAGMPKIHAAMIAAGMGTDEAVLELQPEKSVTVTTDETLNAIFKLPREVAEVVLPAFSTTAVGWCKYLAPAGQDELTPALLRTGALIGQPEFRATMQGMAAKKKAEKAKKKAA